MSLTKVTYSMTQGAVFNALDYGADPTGATNTTAAIQAAIDAANAAYTATGFGNGGNVVYLPAGKYSYTGVILKPGVNLAGAGGWLTQLSLTGASSTGIKSPAAASGLAADAISPQISGLSLVSGETTPTSQVMLNAIGFTYSTFTNVNFEWCGGCSSVTMLNSVLASSGGPAQWYNQFYSCNFIRRASRPAGGIAMQLGDTDGTKEQVTTWTFVGGRVSGAGDGSGLQLRGTGNQFFGVTFEGMDTAVYVGSSGTRGATGNTFVGCYWEGNTVNRQIYANALNTMFTGSFVTGGTDTLSSNSVYFDEVGEYKAWLPSTGAWQVTLQNGGVYRPQIISQSTLSGLDLVDSVGNNVSLYMLPQTSSAHNYLNAYKDNLTDPIWEAGTGSFSPGDDNLKSLGRSAYRWSVVYAATGTINTSDANQKQDVSSLDAAEQATAKAIKGLMKKFKFKSAVAEKGAAARYHFGVIAQEVQTAFAVNGLDASHYGVFCSDTWHTLDGKVVADDTVGATAVTQLGIRYDELLCFVIGAM
jgi:hypothetical protein